VAAPVAAAPIPVSPAVTAASGTDAGQDDLLRLKGVGPKLNLLLIELGVTRYAQIAEWQDSDIAAIDSRLGNFKGRPVRDQWVDQAKYLAAGDIAGFEAKYGKI
jgi:predicted flap endonuclease-1-like 5' DNA nuclease